MSNIPSDSIPENEQPASPREMRRRARRRYVYYDPINRVVWAALLVMAGVVLLADQLHALPSYKGASAWDWIMLGAGAILLLGELARATSGSYGSIFNWQMIGGIVLLALGASAVFGVNTALLWPAALIAIGVMLLARNLLRR